MAAALHVAPTPAVEYVNMHDQAQPPGLTAYVSKQEILKQLVIGRRGLAAFHPALVDASRIGLARVVKVELSKVCDLELHGDRPVALLAFECRRHNSGKVILQS